jgi:hypothetical protein
MEGSFVYRSKPFIQRTSFLCGGGGGEIKEKSKILKLSNI